MKPHWLLEKDVFDENLEPLKKAILDQGMDYTICEYVPFDKEYGIRGFHHGILLDKPVFMYGCLQLARYIQTKKFSIQTYLNLPEFKCSYYYPKFEKYLLQKQSCFIPYGCLSSKIEWLFNEVGDGNSFFVRPDDGYKTFNGQVVNRNSWQKDIELMGFYGIPDETMCVVAAPQNIINEWRFVIGRDYDSDINKVIASSCYKINGNLLENPSKICMRSYASDFVDEVLKNVDYSPDPFWTLDICETKKGFSVLEVGSLSCAGLYGCDVSKVVAGVSDYIDKEYRDIYET